MSNVIKPLRDRDGNVKTNVKICKEMYSILKKLRDGHSAQSPEQRQKDINAFYRITNNSQDAKQIMDWLAQIDQEANPILAQKLIENTLIGVDIPNGQRGKAATQAERKASRLNTI